MLDDVEPCFIIKNLEEIYKKISYNEKFKVGVICQGWKENEQKVRYITTYATLFGEILTGDIYRVKSLKKIEDFTDDGYYYGFINSPILAKEICDFIDSFIQTNDIKTLNESTFSFINQALNKKYKVYLEYCGNSLNL